jgi:hypothetical protein
MKPLPKEFQFKCDEHSLEQCKKLGIDLNCFGLSSTNFYYGVKNNKILGSEGVENNPSKNVLIISLADYIEPELPEWLNSPPVKPNDHSDLIVELTGKYVVGMLSSNNSEYIKGNIGLPANETIVTYAIFYAEETVKQLKEKKYL